MRVAGMRSHERRAFYNWLRRSTLRKLAAGMSCDELDHFVCLVSGRTIDECHAYANVIFDRSRRSARARRREVRRENRVCRHAKTCLRR